MSAIVCPTVLCQKGLSDIYFHQFYRRDKNVILSNSPLYYISVNNHNYAHNRQIN